MGLFNSTPKAGAGQPQSTEAARPQQNKSVGSGKAPEKILSDDAVTLQGGLAASTAQPPLAMAKYKTSVAEDTAFVRETLKHKLAEYGLNPATRLLLQKDAVGQLEINANMPEAQRHAIETDLNRNQHFRDAFGRLSVNQPTLDYVDNVMKLNKAYGTNNALFNSLISRENNFNGLQDIAHRYESLRQTLPTTLPDLPVEASANDRRFQFRLNATA